MVQYSQFICLQRYVGMTPILSLSLDVFSKTQNDFKQYKAGKKIITQIASGFVQMQHILFCFDKNFIFGF